MEREPFPSAALDRWLTTPPEDGYSEEDDMDADELADMGLDQEEPTSLAQSNMDRLAALNALGAGVNGVNEALMLRMMEELLGPVRTAAVKQEHEEWLAEQLTVTEGIVQQMQEQAEEQRRKSTILRRN